MLNKAVNNGFLRPSLEGANYRKVQTELRKGEDQLHSDGKHENGTDSFTEMAALSLRYAKTDIQYF